MGLLLFAPASSSMQAQDLYSVPDVVCFGATNVAKDNEPDASVLLAISREFGKSVDWLLTGEGKK